MATNKRKKDEMPSQTAENASKSTEATGGVRTQAASESLLKRQSAPQPTAAEELQRMQREAMMRGQGMNGNGAVGTAVLSRPIGREQVQEAGVILERYKQGKKNLEARIIENEQWYKLRHWETLKDGTNGEKPTSAYLFNVIASKHADAMDNFPSPNILPREEADKGEAEALSAIIPVILDQCEFEQTYSDVQNYKLKSGTGVYGVFWDKSRLNGLGDVMIRKIDLLNLFWEPGISDIQTSRNLFHLELADNDVLISQYPQLQGKLGGETVDVAKYVYDDTVDTTKKSVVVDWYYKRSRGGKTILHYCKYVNDVVLFATENDPTYAERGFYDHGMYPFVFDALFPVEGTPAAFGLIDVGKHPQEYIDRGNQAILTNMLVNARPRFLTHNDSSLNEDEFSDPSKTFIHVEGSIDDNSFRPVMSTPFNSAYIEVIGNKVEELKETTGNRDVSTGGTTGGATAAASIAALQEAGSKLSRDQNKAAYRAFRKICLIIIELIRQFYDMPRYFRILGIDGAEQFVRYSNANIRLQSQGGIEYGVDQGYRLPLFDVEVTAQKQSPYSKMAQNELALQLYGAGFFNPQMADQALACLDMMDFDRKHFVMQKIAQNGTMYQQMMMMQQQMLGLAQTVDKLSGSNVTEQLIAQFSGVAPVANSAGIPPRNAEMGEALGGESVGESNYTKKARQRAAEATSPT